MGKTVKVAAIQAKRRLISYRMLTVEDAFAQVRASLDILVPLAEKAATMGCDIIAFPEDTPGTIVWEAGHQDKVAEFLRLTEQEMLNRFGQVAAKHGMYIICGSDTIDFRARLFRERNPRAYGILMEEHPPILDKLKHIHVPTREEAAALGAEAFTTGPDAFYEAERWLSEGRTEGAKQRFEELAERFGTTWIGRASREQLKKMAGGQD